MADCDVRGVTPYAISTRPMRGAMLWRIEGLPATPHIGFKRPAKSIDAATDRERTSPI
jgi:hypothetical protein